MDRALLLCAILACVLLNASAQILLRWGARGALASGAGWSPETMAAALFHPGILAGLACYGVSVAGWILVLGKVEASFAYPFLGLGFVLVALAGWQVLGEPLTAQKIAGTLLVTLGVAVLASG